MPVSIHFCMFVISRGVFFLCKCPILVIYFDLRKSEFEFTFFLIDKFFLSFQKTAKKYFFRHSICAQAVTTKKKREAD